MASSPVPRRHPNASPPASCFALVALRCVPHAAAPCRRRDRGGLAGDAAVGSAGGARVPARDGAAVARRRRLRRQVTRQHTQTAQPQEPAAAQALGVAQTRCTHTTSIRATLERCSQGARLTRVFFSFCVALSSANNNNPRAHDATTHAALSLEVLRSCWVVLRLRFCPRDGILRCVHHDVCASDLSQVIFPTRHV